MADHFPIRARINDGAIESLSHTRVRIQGVYTDVENTEQRAARAEGAMSMILLVESKESLATSFSTALSEAGFSVRCEHDGRRALAAADSFDFDAAIIATELRDLPKEQIAQELRSRDPELPIFVCAEFDEGAVARWAVADRMLVLEEPVDETTLVWLLQAHVGHLSGNVPRGPVSMDAS